MRKPIIAGNWKMHKTIAEAVEFVNEIKGKLNDEVVDAVICAPFTLLKDLKDATKGTNIKIGAQNMHFEEKGAFTGEISPLMLKELNIDYVVIVHSERREYVNEADETCNKKVVIAYEPIWAIGTGKTATAEQANDVIAYIREVIASIYGEVANKVRIQYGGSVKPGNVVEIMGQSDIDGALVGGASLEPADYIALVNYQGVK